MKTKNILLLSLVGSISIGVYYMGKNTVLKKLQQAGYITLNDNGKFVLTDKGSSSSVAKVEVVEQPKMFDYNNPATHSSSNFWTKNTVGTFYLPNLQDGKETGQYTEIILGNDGTVKPTIWESVKSAIPFFK